MGIRAPAIIGREAELDELRRTLAGAQEGHGGSVFLVGEPGIGKTRLAATATGMAFDAGMRATRGRGSTIGPMIPFRPLTEALMSLLRDGRSGGLDELGPYRAVLDPLVPELGGQHSAPAGGSLVLLAEAVLRLLAIAGRGRGCLLVLDDLQNADAETLAVVDYLVDNLQAQPVALVGTIRAGQCDALQLARSATQRGVSGLLELRRLDRGEVAAMAASCLATSPDAVPERLVEQLWADSVGVPFVVEELLHEMVSSGLLAPVGNGWQVAGTLRIEVPAALVQSIADRTEQLGPEVRTLLEVAAVLGHRFPLSVVRHVCGSDERTILANLHTGMAAQMVVPDEPAPDWYAFRHPLTGEALLTGLTPAERGELSRRAADGVEALHPELAGDWCPLVASLRLAAGETARAGQLFAEAGRRALHNGAPDSAVALLGRADQLLAGRAGVDVRADILESLLLAMGETSRFEEAFRLADTVERLAQEGLAAPRTAALYARLAGVAHRAGKWADGMAYVDAATAVLGVDARDEDSAPVDVIAAYLMLNTPRPDRLRTATALAKRAAAAAERAQLPMVACDAWQLLGVISREHDLAEADTYFGRSLSLAEQHGLPIKRIYALAMRAGTACLVDGDVRELARTRQEALRVGAISLTYEVDAILALQAVLRAEFGAAAELIDQCWDVVTRLHLTMVARYIAMARATLAAHQGQRHKMDTALADFSRWGGAESCELPLAFGLARTFCALLEEDREQAQRELAQALVYQAENPTAFHLTGKNGLNLLLGVLDGRVGWAHYRQVTAVPASRMRWNAHFVELANAVLLGREGRREEAAAAMAAAGSAAAIYPMAEHLGLRLVAEAAHHDGWGEPAEWLRRAESYIHQAGVPAVASACRAALRRVGVPVPQRRTGAEHVPSTLRSVGVTVREYEVFQLLVDRMGNKAIATRLHISPRTVEKHVASLMTKTGRTDRESLTAYARVVLGPAAVDVGMRPAAASS